MRLFLAIDPGDPVHERLEQAMASLRLLSPTSKWVRACNVHITLAFLGEVKDAALPAIALAIEAAARRHAPLALRFGGGGGFGPARRPRILWAGISGDVEPLTALQGDVARALASLGFPPEDRPYNPHLTLARARDPRGDPALSACAEALQPMDLGAARIDSLILYRSDLSPSGPRYTPVARATLTPPMPADP